MSAIRGAGAAVGDSPIAIDMPVLEGKCNRAALIS
jgi:hypothetical protein